MSIIRREKSRIGVYHVLAQGAGNNSDTGTGPSSLFTQFSLHFYSNYAANLLNSFDITKCFHKKIVEVRSWTGIGRGVIQNL